MISIFLSFLILAFWYLSISFFFKPDIAITKKKIHNNVNFQSEPSTSEDAAAEPESNEE